MNKYVGEISAQEKERQDKTINAAGMRARQDSISAEEQALRSAIDGRPTNETTDLGAECRPPYQQTPIPTAPLEKIGEIPTVVSELRRQVEDLNAIVNTLFVRCSTIISEVSEPDTPGAPKQVFNSPLANELDNIGYLMIMENNRLMRLIEYLEV